MPVYISMLRGVNVGGHNPIKMDQLRELYVSLKLEDPQTYVQSGNVIFRSKKADEAVLARSIQTAIETRFGFRPEIMIRSTSELRKVVAANPFAKRANIESNKLHVSFLLTKPPADALKKLESLPALPEELHLAGRELYIYFPDGMGKSKLPPLLDRLLKVPATARNWNSVTRMLEMASHLED
jgi:uncharacterized protein (DUF1697 family)